MFTMWCRSRMICWQRKKGYEKKIDLVNLLGLGKDKALPQVSAWCLIEMQHAACGRGHVTCYMLCQAVTRPSVGCDASRDRVTAREYSHMTTSYYVTIVISPPHALSWLSWMSWMSCPAWHLIFVFLAHPFISPPSHLRSYFHDTIRSERQAYTQCHRCKTFTKPIQLFKSEFNSAFYISALSTNQKSSHRAAAGRK